MGKFAKLLKFCALPDLGPNVFSLLAAGRWRDGQGLVRESAWNKAKEKIKDRRVSIRANGQKQIHTRQKRR